MTGVVAHAHVVMLDVVPKACRSLPTLVVGACPPVLLAGAVQHKISAKLQQRHEPWRYCQHQRVGRRSISAVRYGSRLQVRSRF